MKKNSREAVVQQIADQLFMEGSQLAVRMARDAQAAIVAASSGVTIIPAPSKVTNKVIAATRKLNPIFTPKEAAKASGMSGSHVNQILRGNKGIFAQEGRGKYSLKEV